MLMRLSAEGKLLLCVADELERNVISAFVLLDWLISSFYCSLRGLKPLS